MDEAFIVDWQTEVGVGGGQVFGILASLPAPAMSCETSLSKRGFIFTLVTGAHQAWSQPPPRQLASQTG